MRSSAVLLAGLASLATAQEVVQLLLPFGGDYPLVGSIIASDADKTTYSITCASSTTASAAAAATTDQSFGEDVCGLPGGATVTQGPSTVEWIISASEVYTYSLDCQLAGTTSAHCTETVIASVDDESATSVTGLSTSSTIDDVTGTDLASAYVPVSITAGGGSTPATTTPATGGAGTTTAATGSGSKTSGATGVQQSSTSGNAAMPQMTGGAKMIVGVVAVAVAAAL